MTEDKNPIHIAIIPDGNRRWAKKRGQSKYNGHSKGVDRIKKTANWALKKNLKYLTFFVFSTENFNRDPDEVDYLMDLLEKNLKKGLSEDLESKDIKIKILGERKDLPRSLEEAIEEAEKRTKENSKMIFSLALNYGGRSEIVNAASKLIKEEKEKITEDEFEKRLWSEDLPDIDLLIRTGKEKRISNFMLWKLAYAELYFSDKLWPDFDEREFEKALEDYSKRKRRFGK